MSTVVVALGGNALTKPGESGTEDCQAANVARMAASVAELVAAGHRIVVTHGNGPQVGNLAIQQFAARDRVPAMPLHLIGAMTQGYMGSIIVRALWDQLLRHRDQLAAIVTHGIVSQDDDAFSHPTKPIGPFLNSDEVREARARGWTVAEDSGRGYRRMVPSPRPCEVLEAAAIKSLLDNDFLVVAGGGGGIPTIRNDYGLLGAEAVIDKDRFAVQIAEAVKAKILAFVTDVHHVSLGFGTADERPIRRMTTADAARYMAAGEFPTGSMGSKGLSRRSNLSMAGVNMPSSLPPMSWRRRCAARLVREWSEAGRDDSLQQPMLRQYLPRFGGRDETRASRHSRP